MFKKLRFYKLSCLFAGCLCFGCSKEYLDKKPNQALLVPTTFADFQALLDNPGIMTLAPGINEISSDDFVVIPDYYQYLSVPAQNSYIWVKDVYEGASIADWNNPYKQVFYANVVLEGLAKEKPDAVALAQWKVLRGEALFFRANAFYNLAQVFASPFTDANSLNPGVPLKLTSNVNVIAQRGTLSQTYNQIKDDLTAALPLLPENAPYKNRPTKSAAYGLMARMALNTGAYNDALKAANNYLNLNNALIDYNTIDPSGARPFPKAMPNSNVEVATYFISQGYSLDEVAVIDPNLFQTYDSNDLRKSIFFDDEGDGLIFFKGSYTGNSSWFAGIATDEIYLVRAESYIRTGEVDKGLADLNILLLNRYKKGQYIPYASLSQAIALKLVLSERRKELVARGLRWQDLRRLNYDPQFAVTISRSINNVNYQLKPNDNRYVFPIPANEIANSGIQQNAR
jgi:hypothetical protein